MYVLRIEYYNGYVERKFFSYRKALEAAYEAETKKYVDRITIFNIDGVEVYSIY